MLRHKELEYVCKNHDSSNAKTQRIGICMLKLQVFEC